MRNALFLAALTGMGCGSVTGTPDALPGNPDATVGVPVRSRAPTAGAMTTSAAPNTR